MKKKIVVLEDDPDISFIIKVILNNEGYEVTSFSSGKTMVEDKDGLPDLYILDKQIPGMDGIEVCKYLKSKEDTQNIPVIMVSASLGFKKRMEGSPIGVEDFLEKPFQIHDLVDKVTKLLG